jgi:hypothetical protein
MHTKKQTIIDTKRVTSSAGLWKVSAMNFIGISATAAMDAKGFLNS